MEDVVVGADSTDDSHMTSSNWFPPLNRPLISAFLSFAIAQFLKLFTTWYKERRWDSRKMIDSGGMPSSHSATVTALAVTIGLQNGTGGPAFAIAVVFACVVMYDASGVRQHAGRQAGLLNQIVCEFPPEHPLSSARPLRDSLGHTPIQASCTLEAGVKIYSLRVDSVHSEAYKVLGGINRVGQENEQDDANVNGDQEGGPSKKELDRKISPLSTLESSFEALNLRKFDVAFAVDPLYHQTSAQFDEGGAKGLLLNNLGVFGGCLVLFDSLEIPGNCMSCATQLNNSDTIDLSFAKESIEQMVLNMCIKDEISPALRNIVDKFDENNQRSLDTFSSVHRLEEQVNPVYNEAELDDGDAFDNCNTWNFDHDDRAIFVNEDSYDADPGFPASHEESEPPFTVGEPNIDSRVERVDDYLFLSLGFASKKNAWAGPDHWKYRKVKGPEDHPATENGSPLTTKRARRKKQAEPDIDFTKALDEEIADVFAPPKNPKSLFLPANRASCNIMLPEDCHYQPENLIKLFLLPNIMCLGRRLRRFSDESRRQVGNYGVSPSWDDENGFDDAFENGNFSSDLEDSSTLVAQPRQVNKVEVQYDKTSKQVDVQALKETLWGNMQTSFKDQEEAVSYRHILASFPDHCTAAPAIEHISPHLCFICLLHLANEHGLSIHGCASLDDLSVRLPRDHTPTSEVI